MTAVLEHYHIVRAFLMSSRRDRRDRSWERDDRDARDRDRDRDRPSRSSRGGASYRDEPRRHSSRSRSPRRGDRERRGSGVHLLFFLRRLSLPQTAGITGTMIEETATGAGGMIGTATTTRHAHGLGETTSTIVRDPAVPPHLGSLKSLRSKGMHRVQVGHAST